MDGTGRHATESDQPDTARGLLSNRNADSESNSQQIFAFARPSRATDRGDKSGGVDKDQISDDDDDEQN